MKISIVIIGDEILLGRVVDTNSSLIARTFTARGWEVAAIRTVGDDENAIKAAIECALAEADLVVTTGGLGPTRDDITKAVLISIFGGSLYVNQDVLADVERTFRERGLVMNELTRSQALVPDSCQVIRNRFGTAPLLWFDKDGHSLVCMPGVPFETRGMIPEVADRADARFHPLARFQRAELTAIGISESALAERLAPFEDALPQSAHLAYLPSQGRVVLRLDAHDLSEEHFNAVLADLRARLGSEYAGDGALSPAQIALALLRRSSLSLATAESCTGGNIAHSITEIPGCSDTFVGSVVSYSNDVKINLLGVPAEYIEAEGAVSEPVVRAMAEGACRVCNADCAVATSGIAGPGGATPDKPVGTVWIAATVKNQTVAHLFHIHGDREAVIDGATARALNLLTSLLK